MSGILSWARVADMPAASILIKLLLYGDSGVGKTWAASTAPDPVYLLTEPNGLATIRAANRNAVVVQADEGHGGLDTVRAFHKAAKDGTLAQETGCKSIVIDSLNELQRMLRDEILRAKRGTANEGVFSLQDWGILTDKMRGLVRGFRDLPYHVIAITHASAESDEATQRRYVGPQFQGRALPNEIAGYFSAVGFMYRERQPNEDGVVEVHRRILLEGPPTVLCKGLPGLDAVEVPDLSSWLERLEAFDASKGVQPTREAKDPTAAKGGGRSSRRRRAAPPDDKPKADEPASGSSD